LFHFDWIWKLNEDYYDASVYPSNSPINKKPREDSISNKSEKNAQNDLHLSIDDSTNSLSNDPSNQSSKNNIIDYINNNC
jgi:hypothetical protein